MIVHVLSEEELDLTGAFVVTLLCEVDSCHETATHTWHRGMDVDDMQLCEHHAEATVNASRAAGTAITIWRRRTR